MNEKIDKANVQEIFELNETQKGILFESLKNPSGVLYNVQLAFRISGSVVLERLIRAISSVQGNNEILRSVFRWRNISKPIQIVLKEVSVPVTLYDFSDKNKEDQSNLLEDLTRKEQIQSFDFTNVPFKIAIIKLNSDLHELHIVHHHILYDGWSGGLLLKEIFVTYHQLSSGYTNPEPPKKISFNTYQKATRNISDQNKSREYWKQYLSGYEIISCFEKVAYQQDDTRSIGRKSFDFSRGMFDAFSRESKVTGASILFLAYGILLQKFNRVLDVVFGTTVSYRETSIKGSDQLMGNFINTQPLRVKDIDDLSLADVVFDIHHELVNRNNFNSTSYFEIKQFCEIKPTDNLFDSLVVIENYPLDSEAININKEFDIALKSVYENTDIPLHVTIFFKKKIEVVFTYRTDCLSDEYVSSLMEKFQLIINRIVNNPNTLVKDLSLLTKDVKKKILFEFNSTKKELDRRKTFVDLFKEQVERVPSRIAVEHAGERLTYSELYTRSTALAFLLKDRGIVAGDRVAIYCPSGIDLLTGILGSFFSAAAYVPIDVGFPEKRIMEILEDCECKVVLTVTSTYERLKKISRSVGTIEDVICVEDLDYSNIGGRHVAETDTNDLAYIIYTSGTTGKPKGVMIHQLGMINHLFAKISDLSLTDKDVIAQTASPCFDISIWQFLAGLIVGGRVCIIDKEVVLQPLQFLEKFRENRITIAESVPSLLTVFLSGLPEDQRSELKDLRWMISTGEALNSSLVKKWFNSYPGVKLLNGYGPTEASDRISHYRVGNTTQYQGAMPIGRPIQNTHLYILDQYMNLCSIGIPGEICVSGIGVGRGYWKDEQKTNESFVPNTIVENDSDYRTIYKTGDIGYYSNEGNIIYMGRKGDQVKIRGFRIELGEVQTHLESYCEISKAVVIVKQNENDKYLVAYYVAPKPCDEKKIRDYLSEKLPNYMLPAIYVYMENMPLTNSGKVNRMALPEPRIHRNKDHVTPSNTVDMALAEIWSEILGVNTSDISTTSGFFDLGGHSLHVVSLINKIRKVFGVEISIQDVFENSTVARLANVVVKSDRKETVIIHSAPLKDYYVLSSAQHRLFYLNELDNESLAYNMPAFFDIEGDLSLEKIENAFIGLIERHECLRTSFQVVNGTPFQFIAEKVDFHIERFESDLEAVHSVCQKFIRSFNLGQASLFRVGVVDISSTKHIMMVDMHHIITDGVSISILIKDFISLYSNEHLDVLPVQYKDYAEWQQGSFKQRLDSHRSFWRKQFLEEIPVLTLPTDFSKPKDATFAGNTLKFELTDGEIERLQSIAADQNTTLFVVFLSVFNLLLSKLCSQEEVIVGTSVSVRESSDIEKIAGLFINTIVLKIRARREIDFRHFLDEVNSYFFLCFRNKDYPFEDLVEDLNRRDEIGRGPLFDVMFEYQNFDQPKMQLPDLTVEHFDYVHKISKFGLTLHINEIKGRFFLSFQYSTELFKPETIARFVSYFKQLVGEITSDTNKKIGEISIVTPGERALLLGDFIDTRAAYADEGNLVAMFEKQVSKTPEQIAVAFKGESLTYHELNTMANRVARWLLDQELKEDKIIALLLDRSLEMIVGILGVLKAGGAYLPIDPDLPKERVNYMLKETRSALLLTHSNYSEKYSQDISVKDIRATDIEKMSGDNLSITIDSSDLAYCIFTSGSTGAPKGVQMEHKGVINLIRGLEEKIYSQFPGPPLRIALLASYAFDASVQQVFASLILGHELHIADDSERKDGLLLKEFYERERIDISDGTPTHLRLLVGGLPPGQVLNHLKGWLLAGEELPKQLVQSFFKKMGESGGVKLFNLYGPTESCVDSTCYQILRDELDRYPFVPIGKPLPNERIYVLDEAGNLVPIGVDGEICIAGDGLARGYIGDDKKTDEKFRRDWIAGEERVYLTGDVGRWLPDGNVAYRGRKDNQIKLRGYRIELKEIEFHLRNYVEIEETVVITREREADTFLVAYYVSREVIASHLLHQYLQEKLPDYMIPSYFVHLEKIPLTSSGKVDRLHFPDPPVAQSKVYEPANTKEEKLLVKIWSEVLGVERIGITDNFFLLGGDSIRSIQIGSRIRAAGFNVSIKDIITLPTIEVLARKLKSINPLADHSVVTGRGVLTPIQRSFFIGSISKKSHYNQSSILHFPEGITYNEVEAIFAKLMEHHDALRMVFRRENGNIIQENLDLKLVPQISEYDLGKELSGASRLVDLYNEVQSGIDLTHGPLIRLGLFHGVDGSKMLIVIHHLVVDGVSWRILFEDIDQLHRQQKNEKKLTLQSKTDSFLSWGASLERYVQGSEHRKTLDFWKRTITKEHSLFPCDHPHGNNILKNVSSVDFQLSESYTKKLLTEVHRPFKTQMNDILLCAFWLSMHQCYGLKSIRVDMEGHGREEVVGSDLSRTVGWFTTIYPVVLEAMETSLSERIKEIKECLHQIPNNGFDYLLWQHFGENSFPPGPGSKILFNYLGQFDDNLATDSYTIASEDAGLKISDEEVSEYEWVVSGILANGQLMMSLSFSKLRYDQNNIDKVMDSYKRNLEELIDFCKNYDGEEMTSSDLTYKDLSKKELNKILSKLEA